MYIMTFDVKYPSLGHVRMRAKRRLPYFVWEYLDSGTGSETAISRNRAALEDVELMPSILHGELTPRLDTELLGRSYSLPVGIGPVGMSGLIWPNAENILAKTSRDLKIPYTLSTVASKTPEQLSADIGDCGWFQLYPPREPDMRKDILQRVRNAGFGTLVLTVDVPVGSRRERMTRSGLTQPPRLTPRILWQISRCPAWTAGMVRAGMPRMKLIDDYAPKTSGLPSNKHMGYLLRTSPDWQYLRTLREEWKGPFVVKGVLDKSDAIKLEKEGVDALWVSNHGGRQFDAAPSSAAALASIRKAVKLPLIMDGGIEGGLDVLRAMALGADFIMMGRAWHVALAALGGKGPAHLAKILKADIEANMGQLGLSHPKDSCRRLINH